MIEIRSVGAIRCATVFAVLYAFLGLIEALFFIPMLALSPPSSAPNAIPPAMKPLFGVGALIILPILFAIAGFIGGVILALLYNLVTRWTGGLQIQIEQVAAEMPAGTL